MGSFPRAFWPRNMRPPWPGMSVAQPGLSRTSCSSSPAVSCEKPQFCYQDGRCPCDSEANKHMCGERGTGTEADAVTPTGKARSSGKPFLYLLCPQHLAPASQLLAPHLDSLTPHLQSLTRYLAKMESTHTLRETGPRFLTWRILKILRQQNEHLGRLPV